MNLLMKQHSQIALFLISLFPFFFMGNVLYANDFSYPLEANSESLVIEEERNVSAEFQKTTEVTPDISGGHPDNISTHLSTAISKKEIAIVSTKDIKSKHLPECFYLGKIPLYLCYLALKLHC